MGKHSIKKNTTKRNTAAVLAAGAGLAVVNAPTAEAAPVTIPNTRITVDVPDQLMPHIKPYLNQAKKASTPLVKRQAARPSVNATVKSVGQRIADAALSKVGAPYAWGAAGPNAFDCSGLTTWAHRQVGKSIPRTSQAQASAGRPVSLDKLQPGDVISYYSGASHVAIYIGNGKVVHAVNNGVPVRVDSLHYMPVNNAVRFF